MTSKVRPNLAPHRPPYLCAPLLLPLSLMRKLRDFYRQYRQYIGTDVLMYGTFILVLALMFVLFG